MNTLIMDELHGILTAYDMMIVNDKSLKKEVALNASRINEDPNFSDESNPEEENFVRKLRKGSNKYKGILPFKFFICVKIVTLLLSVLSKELMMIKKSISPIKRDIRGLNLRRIMITRIRKASTLRKIAIPLITMIIIPSKVRVKERILYSWKWRL